MLSKASFRRRLVVNILAYLGAVATVLQLVLWGTDSSTLKPPQPYVAAFILGAVVVVWRTMPPRSLEMSHSSYSASFELSAADLFTITDCPIVITMNRNFDTGPPWVADRSLVVQLASRWFPGDSEQISAQVERQRPATSGEAEVGEILPLTSKRGDALLLAVARRHDEQTSTVLVGDLADAEARLWDYARKANLGEVAVPLLGAGFARAQIGPIPLLMVLLTSYVTASMEVPTCHLRLILGDDVDLDVAIEIVREYGTALGFK